MSLLTALTKKVADLTTAYNSLIGKIYKTDAFTHQEDLNASSKIRVFINGISQYVTIEQIVYSSVLSLSNVGVNGIVSGSIEYVEGLNYRTLNLVYRLNNTLYYSNGFDLISNNGGAQPRKDVYYGDSDLDGLLFIKEGDEAVIPSEPILEWGHQLKLTHVDIPAGATAPENVLEITLYDENLQEVGGEWDSYTDTPAEVDLVNEEDFNTGVLSVKFINAGIVGFSLINSVSKNGSNISFIKFRTKLISNIDHILRVSLFSEAGLLVGDVDVKNNTFNFNATLLNEWQTIVIPGTAFRQDGIWGSETYNKVNISNKKSGTTCFIDSAILQTGVNHQSNVFEIPENSIGVRELKPELKATIDLGVSNEVNWMAGVQFKKTLGATTIITHANLVENKTTFLQLTGEQAFSIQHVAEIGGIEDYDGALINVLQMHCTDATPGAEKITANWFNKF